MTDLTVRQVIVFEMAAGIFALVDQMLVVVEEFEETHRNLRDVDNLLQSRDPDEVLTLALKAELVRPTLPTGLAFHGDPFYLYLNKMCV